MQSYLPLITGSGGALIVLALGLYLFITGKLHTDGEFQRALEERDHLRDALETERTTNNELARSGGVAVKALDALVEVATSRREHDQADRHREIAHESRDLTAGDLGL